MIGLQQAQRRTYQKSQAIGTREIQRPVISCCTILIFATGRKNNQPWIRPAGMRSRDRSVL
jgi:hypothetical protein